MSLDRSQPAAQVIVDQLVELFRQIRKANGYWTDFGARVRAEDEWHLWNEADLAFEDGSRRPPLMIAEAEDTRITADTSALREYARVFIAQGLAPAPAGRERREARRLEDDMQRALPLTRCGLDDRVREIKLDSSGFELLEAGSSFVEVTLRFTVFYRTFKEGLPTGP